MSEQNPEFAALQRLQGVMHGLAQPIVAKMMYGKGAAKFAIRGLGGAIDDLDKLYELSATPLGERLATISAVIIEKADDIPTFQEGAEAKHTLPPTLARACGMLIDKALSERNSPDAMRKNIKTARQRAKLLYGLCSTREAGDYLIAAFKKHRMILMQRLPTLPPPLSGRKNVDALQTQVEGPLKLVEEAFKSEKLLTPDGMLPA